MSTKQIDAESRHASRCTYKIDEAAALLGIGRSAAYDAARNGQLPSIRIGKRLLVPKAALDRMLSGEAA